MCLKQYFKSIKIFLITNINGQAVQQFWCRSQARRHGHQVSYE